jgi:hypothetical protein
VLVRTRAGAEELANGRRSGGSTAVSEGGETDERDPLVSDHAERGARARRPRGPSKAGRPAGRFPNRALQ